MPGVLLAAQVPLLVLIIAGMLLWSLKRRPGRLPFFMVLTLFALTYVGLGVSVFPYLVPPQVSLWDAAASAVILPLIIAYTAWAHRVFRGKVAPQGYHE